MLVSINAVILTLHRYLFGINSYLSHLSGTMNRCPIYLEYLLLFLNRYLLFRPSGAIINILRSEMVHVTRTTSSLLYSYSCHTSMKFNLVKPFSSIYQLHTHCVRCKKIHWLDNINYELISANYYSANLQPAWTTIYLYLHKYLPFPKIINNMIVRSIGWL